MLRATTRQASFSQIRPEQRAERRLPRILHLIVAKNRLNLDPFVPNILAQTAGHRRLDKEDTLQLIQPLFGDLMFDGVGLLGCLFVLVLMWDAWKDWNRAGAMRKRRKRQLPYSTSSRRPARGFFRKSRTKLALLVATSSIAVMLVGGRQNPHGDKASPTTPAATLNSATDNNASGNNDSAHPDEAILTYQTLPPESGAGGSIASGNSNAIASHFGNIPDATNSTLNHP